MHKPDEFMKLTSRQITKLTTQTIQFINFFLCLLYTSLCEVSKSSSSCSQVGDLSILFMLVQNGTCHAASNIFILNGLVQPAITRVSNNSRENCPRPFLGFWYH